MAIAPTVQRQRALLPGQEIYAPDDQASGAQPAPSSVPAPASQPAQASPTAPAPAPPAGSTPAPAALPPAPAAAPAPVSPAGNTPAPAAAPAAPAGPVYDTHNAPIPLPDFNRIQQDGAAEGMPGYVWHHNGTGWDLRPASMIGTSGAPGAAAAPDPASVLQSKLIEFMNRSTTPLETDPEIAKPIEANRNAEQRAFDRARQMLAERSAARGGGFETQLLGLAQDRAGRESEFEGNLYKDAAQQRIAQIQNALTLGSNYLDAQAKNKLQRELGQLQADVQRYGISEGGRQADAELGFKNRQLDLDEAFRRAGLDSSNSNASASRGEAARQFDVEQAQQQAMFEASMNQQALLQLLGMYGE